jgi:glucosamine--fructose-6-phosphate aminotransferase (isomerizing)
MKAMVLATGKGTRLFPLIRRTVVHTSSTCCERRRGERPGKTVRHLGSAWRQSEVLARSAEKKPEHNARISRRRRASLPRTNSPNAVPWPLFASFGLLLQAALFPSRGPESTEEGVPVVCGIVGYVGNAINKEGEEGQQRCVEVLMEGLGRLEYRGYDSAGLALLLHDDGGDHQEEKGRIEAIKRPGHLQRLSEALAERNGDLRRSRAGVGHTRWATHGSPSEVNAHPQLADGVAVVHNGIIENFAELKEELIGRGVTFASQTDTEVIVHLIAEGIAHGCSLREALGEALRRLRGSFAVAAISANEPGKVVAARHQSPLVVGLGEGENFLASALQALLEQTRQFVVIENGEIAELTGSCVEIFTLAGEPVRREASTVEWDAEAVELGSFEDYMLKEIHEQPAALRATLSGRLLGAGGSLELFSEEELELLDLASIERVVIVACGRAYHAGLLGKGAIERFARLPVEVAVASEYRYAYPIGDERTLVIAVSQSGETTDTLAALQATRNFGGRILAVTNTQGSLITREANAVLLTKAGPEIGVAATKTFLAQVAALQILALELGKVRGAVGEGELLKLERDLRLVPDKVQQTLEMMVGRSPCHHDDVLEEAISLFEEARCALW